jgi:hypothetical protein
VLNPAEALGKGMAEGMVGVVTGMVMGRVNGLIQRGRRSLGVLSPEFTCQSGTDAKVRKAFSECLTLDQMLTYGSCIPVISNVVGSFRVLYGLSIAAYGVCEIINSIAQQNLQKTPVTIAASIRGGGLPFMTGLEHMIVGYAAQRGLMGNIGCIIYTLLRRNPGDPESKKEVEVDPQALSTLFNRLKKEPFYKTALVNIQAIWNALFGLPEEGAERP